MKCFILGLDGIEYDFVEAWDTRNLMQAEYGKIEVPIGKEGVPKSPQVWASFLTGNIENVSFDEGPKLYYGLLSILKFFKKYINLSLGMGPFINRKRIKKRGPLGFKRKFENPTFLDVTNSKAINAPFINHDNSCFNLMHQFFIDKLTLEKTIELLLLDHNEHKKMILQEIDEEKKVDIIFAFLNHIDHFQHLSLYRQEIVEEIYSDIDNYVGVLKEQLTIKHPNSYFIIVSDHGFDFNTGKHSKHAFYSANIPLDPAPKKITDFYTIITSLAS